MAAASRPMSRLVTHGRELRPNKPYLDSSVKRRHVGLLLHRRFPIPISPYRQRRVVELRRSDCIRISGLWSGAQRSGP